MSAAKVDLYAQLPEHEQLRLSEVLSTLAYKVGDGWFHMMAVKWFRDHPDEFDGMAERGVM